MHRIFRKEPEMKKRTRYEIYMDTLNTVKRKRTPAATRTSYSANLPVDRANERIPFLCCRRLLKEQRNGNDRLHRLKSRGGEFLKALETMNTHLDG